MAKESVAGDSTALLFMRVATYRATGERSRKPGAIVWGRITRTFEALTLTCWLCFLVESFADQQGLVLVDFFSPMPSLMLKKPQKGFGHFGVHVFKLRTRKLTLISYFDGSPQIRSKTDLGVSLRIVWPECAWQETHSFDRASF